MDKLQFDEMEVNTDLAKEYFKKNNHEFIHKSGYNLQSEKDRCGNTIFYSANVPGNLRNHWITDDLTIELEQKFRRLAEEVEKYAETFCQIEYMMRKIPVDEVRNYDIKLIVQNLSLGFRARTTTSLSRILMNETTPLFNLGLVVQVLKSYRRAIIVASKNTAAVCHFFTELCHSVGLDSVETCFRKEEPNVLNPVLDTGGCIGVVTERSDVDSAVDTFVRTTTRYPWRLTRVLVQESVLGVFGAGVARAAGAASLEAGATPPASDATPLTAGATPLAAGDALSLAAPGAAPVPVDAYRTTKELLAWLQEHRPTYLSLWASDISTANEIAYNVPSSVVWINGYGIFDGPPQTSQGIYNTNIVWSQFKYRVASRDGLLQRQKAWAKLTFEERREIVLNVTDRFFLDDKDNEFYKSVRSALLLQRNLLESGNFVNVDSDRICVGLSSVPHELIFYDEFKIEQFATLLTVGSALIYDKNLFNVYSAKLASGIPVALLNKYLDHLASRIPITVELRDCGNEVVLGVSAGSFDNCADLLKTKIVWTSFGTIFAN